MGICWSEPPVAPVQTTYTTKPTAPPYQAPMDTYPPPIYNPQYTYAVKPQEQVYYQYPVVYQQQYPVQQPQRQVSPATAFVGGLVLASIVDDILDPCE